MGLAPEKQPERRLLGLWAAAVTKIAQCSLSEAVTGNTNARLFESCYWNEDSLNPLPRIKSRASLVPAAAVIPARRRNIKFVAVKKLVVELVGVFFPGPGAARFRRPGGSHPEAVLPTARWEGNHRLLVTVNKSKRSSRALARTTRTE